jgi:hypothetical protein
MYAAIWSKARDPEAEKFHPADTLQLAYTASTILEALWMHPHAEFTPA